MKEETGNLKLETGLASLLGRDPTPEEIASACMYMDHSFGLMDEGQRKHFAFVAIEWLRAWCKVHEDSRSRDKREIEEMKREAVDRVRHVTADEVLRAHNWHERVKELVADLMELALDNRCSDPCWQDPARRYCELRNEAVRLGLREGKLMELDEPNKREDVEA